MKKLFAILFLLVSLASSQAALVTATVTITNAPTNGNTFVLNSSTRTWTNVVWSPTVQILTNSSIGGIMTNLYMHLAANGSLGVNISTNGTNSFKLYGSTVVVATNNYLSVSYVTNTTDVGSMLRLPFSVQVNTNRTNNASYLVEGIDAYATNTFTAASVALTNHVNLSANQTITGAKTFSGANVYSNANQLVDGGVVTNVLLYATGGYIVNPSYTRTNNTALANGNNAALSIADKAYVKLSGPSAAFTVNGIAGGSDGRIVTLQNSTGYTLTIANDSGTDPTAANRIYTGTGGNITQTNNPGTVSLIYDSAASRWVVTGKN